MQRISKYESDLRLLRHALAMSRKENANLQAQIELLKGENEGCVRKLNG